MLGSFYEKAWDFERQTTRHSYINSTPLFSQKTDPPPKQTVNKFFTNMHLPNGSNEMLQLGGGGVGSKTLAIAQEVMKNGHEHNTNANGEDVGRNEILVSTPSGKSRKEIVEAIIAGWILLVHRYQRDAFHNFTWGLEGAGNAGIQSIPATELNLLNNKTISDVLEVARSTKSNEIPIEQRGTPVLVFNDGTKDEVRRLYEAHEHTC
jgi:hypothetical protein